MSIYTSAGMTKGAHESYSGMADRNARTAEAKNLKERSAIELKEYKDGGTLRKTESDLQLAQATAQLKTIKTANSRQTAYTAFDRYDGDGDIRHLNSILASEKGKNSYWYEITNDSPQISE